MNVFHQFPAWSSPFFLAIVLNLILSLVALVHCVKNEPTIPRKILRGLGVVFLWPFAIYYVFKATRPLKIFGVIWLACFIASNVWKFQSLGKQIQRMELDNTPHRPTPEYTSKVLSPEVLSALEHTNEYQKWLDNRAYQTLIDSFIKDEKILSKGDRGIRSRLHTASFQAALAYRALGQSKKAAYYYALAAKIELETNPQNSAIEFYIDEAKKLDPTSDFVKQVEKRILK